MAFPLPPIVPCGRAYIKALFGAALAPVPSSGTGARRATPNIAMRRSTFRCPVEEPEPF